MDFLIDIADEIVLNACLAKLRGFILPKKEEVPTAAAFGRVALAEYYYNKLKDKKGVLRNGVSEDQLNFCRKDLALAQEALFQSNRS